MTTPLTAFPADGYTARWSRVDVAGDVQGNEQVDLRWDNEGWTVTGEVAGPNITYVLRLSATWAIRQFLLFRDLDEPDLWLGTDGSGRWGEMNGAHRPDLDGCVEVDLAVTPFSHTVPIRRLGLDIGHSVELTAASIDVETLGVVPVQYRLDRLTDQRFRRTTLGAPHPDSAVDAPDEIEFDIDPYGLVHDVAGRFERS